jgi:hypothetical protein
VAKTLQTKKETNDSNKPTCLCSQALAQLFSLLATMAIAVGGGLITGLLLSRTCFNQHPAPFDDAVFFNVPYEDALDEMTSMNNDKDSLELVVERTNSFSSGGAGSLALARLSTPLPGVVEDEGESEEQEKSNGHREKHSLSVPVAESSSRFRVSIIFSECLFPINFLFEKN